MKPRFRAFECFGLLLAAILLLPSMAFAHVGGGESGGLSHGFGHPLGGLDHICAMIAVGLWAAQMGGRALWAIPLTFVTVMIFGAVSGMMVGSVPFIETGIVLSVLTLGVLIAAAVRLPLAASILLVGLFSICHGYAHGTEMPATASGVEYALGFVIATTVLHSFGIAMGIGIEKLSKPLLVRFAGAGIALCAVYLWLA